MFGLGSGSGSDGIVYSTTDVPVIATNTNDLEISNYTMRNENIVTTRGVTTSNGNTVLLLQEPSRNKRHFALAPIQPQQMSRPSRNVLFRAG